MDQTRLAVSGYRAAGLRKELARFRQLLEDAGATVDIEQMPVALSSLVESALCLALREAGTNIVRHAQATRCAVQLVRDGADVRLTIRNNGAQTSMPSGNGLIGIRDRSHAIGGHVEVHRDGDEFELRLMVPYGT